MDLGTNFGTKAKHKSMLLKKHTIFINKIKQHKMNKHLCHSLCSIKIVFQVFPQVIKVWKTVNKFHPNCICLLINEIETFVLVNKGDFLLQLNME